MVQDYTKKINDLYSSRTQAAITELDRSKSKALAGLENEKKEIQPRYYKARNDTATQTAQSARNFAEFMASRGGVRAGSNAQAELMRNSSYQRGLGEIGKQENAAFDDISRRTTTLENDYLANLQQVKAQIESERLQSIVEEQRRQEQARMEQSRWEQEYALKQQQLALQRASRSGGGSGRGRSGGKSGSSSGKSFSNPTDYYLNHFTRNYRNTADAIADFRQHSSTMKKEGADLGRIVNAIEQRNRQESGYKSPVLNRMFPGR